MCFFSDSLTFSQIIKKLIERKQAQIRKVYPGLSCFKEGVRQIPIESIPGIRMSGLYFDTNTACWHLTTLFQDYVAGSGSDVKY